MTALDINDEVAVVFGKGRWPRSCPFGAKTGHALDRYLRVRGRHKHASLPGVAGRPRAAVDVGDPPGADPPRPIPRV
ncbi:MAG TPA: hypothetical protein VK875_05360 [Euzebyales bacterium]|nr:hypothetical protein [Euzebyales bacterium]